MKHVVITGVSSGIGYETLKKFHQQGYFVFGSVRTEQDKNRLEQEFTTNFKALLFDITNQQAIKQAAQEVEHKVGKQGLNLLINNAGIAVFGPMEHISQQDFNHQLQINLWAPIQVTQCFLPILGANSNKTKNKGRIIMISSTAGKFTRPMLGPYSASKHGLEAISDAWRRELKYMYGIKLIVVEPGPIKTEIWNKAKNKENKYQNTAYGKIFDALNKAVADIENIAIPATKVANVIWKANQTKHPKTRYLIAPKQFLFWLALYVIPDKILDKILIKELKKLNQ